MKRAKLFLAVLFAQCLLHAAHAEPAFQPASDVPGIRFVEDVVDAGMSDAGGIEYALRFFAIDFDKVWACGQGLLQG